MTMRSSQGVFIADTARVLGRVELGRAVSIWYGVSIRGDVAPITIGELTNVQDNAVVHCEQDMPNVIAARVTIGHGAIVHGLSVGEGTLIGMGARVLAGTKVGRGCIIAAGAVLTPGTQVPDGMVVMGVPGRIVRQTSDQEKQYILGIPPRYAELARLHCEQRDDPRVRMWPGECASGDGH